ncbi:FHA domain-containing protein [Oculatella sp. LEGE 06141]|uniref:FHA domain-containing protein n=1 Tax=Oculatella sp. LEGE 06141 TaxID=1828648 RepID=UPI00187DE3FF|nr:FHA domain-containing protein [Oculatella sp. LEGE 06141]MBE9179998.1 FHA domain-containing protein [Oculatella sp. LEGE 06141]
MLKIKQLNTRIHDIQVAVVTPETLPQQECLIGRAAHCHLILDSVDVSRVHGKILLQNGQYYYNDLGSANGSYFNDKPIAIDQLCCLKPGDRLSIGDFVLLIEAIEPVSQPLSPQSNRPMWTNGNLTVHCIRIVAETADVKTFTFVAEPAILFDYLPGQFVTLELDINGEEVLRSYSISSSPTRPHTLEITVKRVPPPADAPQAPPGLVSNWLHDHLKVGHSVKLNGILGKFTCLPDPPTRLLMISAGSGITPMMSMSRWFADTGAETEIVFFHCARTPGDIIFRQELELMAARLANFRLAIATTRPQPGHSWFSFTGRLDPAMLQTIAPDFGDRTVYVCGPEGFMQSTKTLFEGLGFPMQNYHEESFGAPKKLKEAKPKPPVVSSPVSASSQPSVYFSQSQKDIASDGTETLLELAEQAGIKIRSNCRQGVCGACKKRKLEGSVRYDSEPDGLNSSDRDAGYVLTCVAAPLDRVVLEA